MSNVQHYHQHNYGVNRMVINSILGVGAIWLLWIFVVVVVNYPWLFLGALIAAVLACVLILPHVLRQPPQKEVCPISGLNPCPWHPQGGPHPVINQ